MKRIECFSFFLCGDIFSFVSYSMEKYDNEEKWDHFDRDNVIEERIQNLWFFFSLNREINVAAAPKQIGKERRSTAYDDPRRRRIAIATLPFLRIFFSRFSSTPIWFSSLFLSRSLSINELCLDFLRMVDGTDEQKKTFFISYFFGSSSSSFIVWFTHEQIQKRTRANQTHNQIHTEKRQRIFRHFVYGNCHCDEISMNRIQIDFG